MLIHDFPKSRKGFDTLKEYTNHKSKPRIMKTIQISKTLLTMSMFFLVAVIQAQDRNMDTQNEEETDASISLESDDQTDIASYLANSEEYTTLAKAVEAANLVATLSSDGPFTVFAPTNSAFKALPEGKLAKLLLPENKLKLETILKYHVIAGEVTSEDIMQAISLGNGKAEFKTVSGESLTASVNDNGIILTDANGNVSNVTNADSISTNGIVHTIDALVLPLKKNAYKN